MIVTIRDLVVNGKHGVHPEEKTTAQPFKVSVELELAHDRASKSDDLADSVDYSTLRQAIIATIETTSFNLLERLAQEIANNVLANKQVKQVTVTIEKPAVYDNGMPGVSLTLSK